MKKVFAVVTAGALFQLTGCVSQSTYDDALSQNQSLEAQLQAQTENNSSLRNTQKELTEEIAALREKQEILQANNALAVSEKAALEAKLTAKEDSMSNKLAELRSTFSQELEENSIKIEMLRNDIKVDLSDDILYASGQAELTEKGKEVIKKVAAQLANSPYIIRVIGNTDNIPITGRLANRYPSNWDLAAARAVGVVRLLQSEGVEPEKVEAVSRGEYYPVAENDSDEGRAKNRRTEILLRVQ
ncbi:MAG: OmpA family protein [Pseudomonadales bacterium]|uniref:OmpA family outer membrane lipoprotein n=1 Tax=Oleiphilus messinensis TaxID=141451 RepID=A0A1Y0ID72_9GAMM|nr:OmpA family protein [Oleiphilus messinensis]ARU58200.1 OmpA family outer membrane lipoprotein [Oleiphilus messinensis]MCG8613590.1 OmpA family protein [Pseudomonadales bacterium]